MSQFRFPKRADADGLFGDHYFDVSSRGHDDSGEVLEEKECDNPPPHVNRRFVGCLSTVLLVYTTLVFSGFTVFNYF